jgi:restriction endonuclease Mrr
MYRAHSRVIEMAVGSILRERLGAILEITKETRDSGVDFFGFDSERGRFVVEVKRWKKPVGVSIVRQIAGVLLREEMKTALIVATAGFTGDARKETRALHNRLNSYPVEIELVDVRDLVAWLRASDSRPQYRTDEDYWREHIRAVNGMGFT